MRFSRPCYDKPHRCPGWAGGGLKFAAVVRCKNGSIRTRDMRVGTEDGRPVGYGRYPAEDKWRFGHCYKCDVITWPWAFRKLDPTWWADEVRRTIRNLKYKWEDR